MDRMVNIVTSITDLNQLQHLPETIDLVEVRADLIGHFAMNPIHKSIPKVFVLKSKEEGGTFQGDINERKQCLITASYHYDFVELEGERDLIPEILAAIPCHKRRISWEGAFTSFDELNDRSETYQRTSAVSYKFIVDANDYAEAFAVTNLVKLDTTNKVVAYARGEFARFTQVLPAYMGAPEVHCNLNGEDLYTVEQLIKNYGLPHVFDVQELYGIVGNPVKNSISPELHNKAYRQSNLPFLYLPFTAENFQEFSQQVIKNNGLPVSLKGLTVVSPFKKEGFDFANPLSTGEACNGLVRNNNQWEDFSTDAWGALQALKTVANWRNKRIAIVGTGGTGQTIAKELKKQDIALTLVNRTIEKGEKIARELGYPFVPLNDFDPSHFNIIIHATPLGKKKGEIPFELSKLKHQCLVVDHVYPKTDKSELVKYCELLNIKVIDGKTIARIQIKKQFENMTNRDYPEFQNIETLEKRKIN